MITLLRREFEVELPLEQAWNHLARVEQWPSWAKHIRKIELQSPGKFGSGSTGRLHLVNGLKPAFTVTEFNPFLSWKWVGGLLWMTVPYDHQFEALDAKRTKLTFTVEAEGCGASVLGRLFALIYRRDLNRAIARLVAEMNGMKPDA